MALDLEREKRFSNAMALLTQGEGYEPFHILKARDWNVSPQPSVFVDIGGSHGAVSIELTRHLPNLRCIVQDYPDVVAKAQDSLPPDLSPGHVQFMSHDFFKEEPVKGTNVIFTGSHPTIGRISIASECYEL